MTAWHLDKASTGFEPVTFAIPVRCSTNWAKKLRIGSELFYMYFTSLHSSRENELNKLTSLPMCGFIAQLVEHRTGIAEVTGSNLVEALIQAFSFQLLKLENLLRWSFFTLRPSETILYFGNKRSPFCKTTHNWSLLWDVVNSTARIETVTYMYKQDKQWNLRANPRKNQTKSYFLGKVWKLNFAPLLHIASLKQEYKKPVFFSSK